MRRRSRDISCRLDMIEQGAAALLAAIRERRV